MTALGHASADVGEAVSQGARAQLSTDGRVLPDTTSPQGSPVYPADVVPVDKALQQWLSDNRDIVQGLVDGTVRPRHQLVHATEKGTVRIFELTLDPALILKVLP